jgi:hypothetical protein
MSPVVGQCTGEAHRGSSSRQVGCHAFVEGARLGVALTTGAVQPADHQRRSQLRTQCARPRHGESRHTDGKPASARLERNQSIVAHLPPLKAPIEKPDRLPVCGKGEAPATPCSSGVGVRAAQVDVRCDGGIQDDRDTVNDE